MDETKKLNESLRVRRPTRPQIVFLKRRSGEELGYQECHFGSKNDLFSYSLFFYQNKKLSLFGKIHLYFREEIVVVVVVLLQP